jgi:hypothetical protein
VVLVVFLALAVASPEGSPSAASGSEPFRAVILYPQKIKIFCAGRQPALIILKNNRIRGGADAGPEPENYAVAARHPLRIVAPGADRA